MVCFCFLRGFVSKEGGEIVRGEQRISEPDHSRGEGLTRMMLVLDKNIRKGLLSAYICNISAL